jgi:anti-sigma factor RsiW
MPTDDCSRIEFLLQADFDGELAPGETAALAAHLAQCLECRQKQAALTQLSARLRAELPYYGAPDRLRQAIEARVASSTQHAPSRVAGLRRLWMRLFGRRVRWPLPFGAGAALAVAIVLLAVLPRGGELAGSVIASHIRALQPGHLMDVVSTDQHTVKPWFDGRLDYSPPVKDLAAQGFPLLGGRLDYLHGRPVAVLVYRRAKHIIDLYAWPTATAIDLRASTGERNGYNTVRWTQDGMTFWAVSDVNAAELGEFVERWRAAQ